MNKVEQVNQLHEQAMDIAEEMYFAQRKKDTAAIKKWAKSAFSLEQKAAMLLVNDYDIEPTRSVLFKSAACLAINAEMYQTAEQMIGFALSGTPPYEIRNELKDLLLELPSTQETAMIKDELLTNQIYQLPKDLRQMAKEFIDFLVQKQTKRA
jgi:uncharacterized protein (UPF0297 family)